MNPRTNTPSRLLLTVAFTTAALLLGIIGAVAAGTGTVTPPPKIAFVTTNANVAPDALTVGPMAGRLGAPLFITNSDNLNEDVKDALVAYAAELIIVAGGPNTVTDGVMAQISAATGLAIKNIDDTPAAGVVRVAGSGRDQTAVALSELIASYNPNFLPTDATAADSDLLDGKDSTAFLGKTEKGADADKLDGIDSTGFLGWPVQTRSLTTGIYAFSTTFAEFRELAGYDEIRPTSGSFARFNVDLNVPPVPVGTNLELTALEVCYRVDNAADSITNIILFDFEQTGAFNVNTALNSTTAVCTPIDVGDGVSLGRGTVSLWIGYSFGGTGSSRDLQFYGAQATWDLA